MSKRLALAAALVLAAGCGGGGGGSNDTPPPGPATITVGSTVVQAGASKTITANIGDTLTIVASEVVPSINISHATGKTCTLNYPNGIQTNVDTFTVKLAAGTTECILKFALTGGDAILTVQVP